jgi:hypothetical protein
MGLPDSAKYGEFGSFHEGLVVDLKTGPRREVILTVEVPHRGIVNHEQVCVRLGGIVNFEVVKGVFDRITRVARAPNGLPELQYLGYARDRSSRWGNLYVDILFDDWRQVQIRCSHIEVAITDADCVTLYRPVGSKELALISTSGFRQFPPRLPDQPIFYPVLTEEYAAKIALEWNATKAGTGYAGYVTRFRVGTEYLSRYEVHTVGGSRFQEYWIPAEELPELNANIVGSIEVIAEFHGPAEGNETR